MQKYLLKYFSKKDNKWRYVCGVNENGESYSLVEKKEEAKKFFGKKAKEQIAKRIKKDSLKRWSNYMDIVEIEEIDEPPVGYFEFCYAVSRFDKSVCDKVPKGYLKLMTEGLKEKIVEKHKKYPNWENPEKIIISDIEGLGVEEIKKYYNWRKNNYKGTLIKF